MVAKPLCPLYKNIIKPLDRARYPELRFTILAQATTFTILVVILHHFFEIFPCFHYQIVLITDAKVIYYIGTAIRANGDLLPNRVPSAAF